MNTNVKIKTGVPAADTDLGRSQAIFVVIGVAIILGGLWLLHTGTGPYHPDLPVTDAQIQTATGS